MSLRYVVLLILLNLVFTSSAYAYLDPNAGGFFLQVIIPVVFGTAAAITVFWKRVLSFFKGLILRFRNQDTPHND